MVLATTDALAVRLDAGVEFVRARQPTRPQRGGPQCQGCCRIFALSAEAGSTEGACNETET